MGPCGGAEKPGSPFCRPSATLTKRVPPSLALCGIHSNPPPPLSFPGGGGGGSLGQPKIFCCGSLCCCVGDCVVGHCHLYPLHSWQDILLTFAEMELDNTTMFPPGTNVMRGGEVTPLQSSTTLHTPPRAVRWIVLRPKLPVSTAALCQSAAACNSRQPSSGTCRYVRMQFEQHPVPLARHPPHKAGTASPENWAP